MITASRCTEVSEMEGVKTVRFVHEPSDYRITSGEFAEELLELVDCDGIVVIDFSGITRVLTKMISDLLMLRKAITYCRGELRLTGMGPKVYEVFKLLRLTSVFEIA